MGGRAEAAGRDPISAREERQRHPVVDEVSFLGMGLAQRPQGNVSDRPGCGCGTGDDRGEHEPQAQNAGHFGQPGEELGADGLRIGGRRHGQSARTSTKRLWTQPERQGPV